MAKSTLSERATKAVYDRWHRRDFKQTDLAARLRRPGSVVNRIIHGSQPVTLDVLEAVGELTGVDPMELLADPATLVHALNPMEAELLRYARGIPRSTLDNLLGFLRFFAGEDALTQQLRQATEYLRAMGKSERDRAMAYLLLMHEGGLPRDVRIALGLPETDDVPRTRRRRATTTT